MYPAHRRCTREEGFAALDQAIARGATLKGIERALLSALESPAWNRDGGRYIRTFVNWLASDPWRGPSISDLNNGEEGIESWKY